MITDADRLARVAALEPAPLNVIVSGSGGDGATASFEELATTEPERARP